MVGMMMLLQFVVSSGFIVVVNAPQNMVAYETETFDARQFRAHRTRSNCFRAGVGDGSWRNLVSLARLRLIDAVNRLNRTDWIAA